jgi:glutamyl-tRNA synthetase
MARFFFRDPVYDPQAVQKRLRKEGARELLLAAAEVISATIPFDHTTLEARIRAFCDAHQVKFGDVNHVLRVAVTGQTTGVGVFETLAILGKEEMAKRIAHALNAVMK